MLKPDFAEALNATLGGALSNAKNLFHQTDLDGDGIVGEPRAKTTMKGAASSLKGGAAGAAGKIGSIMRRQKQDQELNETIGDEPRRDRESVQKPPAASS